jgi:hypothetical protein
MPSITPTTTLPPGPEAASTPTAFPTETPKMVDLPVDSVIENQCPKISGQFTPNGTAKGILLYYERLGESVFFNLETSEKKPLGAMARISHLREIVSRFILRTQTIFLNL